MKPELAQFTNKGMNQDLSISKSVNEFAFENYNIRITRKDIGSNLSITNEKGPKKLSITYTTNKKYNKISLDNSYKYLKAQYSLESDVTIIVGYRKIESPYTETTEHISFPRGKSLINISKEGYNVIPNSVNIPGNYKEDDSYYYYMNTAPTIQTEVKDTIEGQYLGHCVLNDNFVLFTHCDDDDTDYIYKFTCEDDSFKGIVLYKGNLDFDLNHPIETLGYYESDDIQKVYWVDGKNLTRAINIVRGYDSNKNKTQFDFNIAVSKIPIVKITKEYNSIGVFPSGVIQYFISYYNKYGPETNLIYSSDLQYLNFKDRGASPEERVNCSFNIKIENIDTSFDYLRIYSAIRTSENAEIQFSLVKDLKIDKQDKLSFIDNNTTTEVLDPTLLYFIGGQEIIASTIAQKDDVLFLGDITIENIQVNSKLKDYLNSTIIERNGIKESTLIKENYKSIPYNDVEGYYPFKQETLNSSSEIKTFKRGEIYRFAIQFQTFSGQWTAPIWIGDKKCMNSPKVNLQENTLEVANFYFNAITDNIFTSYTKDYLNYRILMAETSALTRNILAQGVVCPTLFNYGDRIENKPFAISSWIMRPINGNVPFDHMEDTTRTGTDAEIQCNQNRIAPIVLTNNKFVLEEGENLCISLGKAKKVLKHGIDVAIFVRGDLEVIDVPGYPINHSFDIKALKSFDGYKTYREYYDAISEWVKEQINIDLFDLSLTENDFSYFCEHGYDGQDGRFSALGWENQIYIPEWNSWIENNNKIGKQITLSGAAITEDLDYRLKRNNFYVDTSILTFHSPDLDTVSDLIDDTKLTYKIVGIVPLTGSYNDSSIILKSAGISKYSSISDVSSKNVPNIGKAKIATNDFLYHDYVWRAVGNEDTNQLYIAPWAADSTSYNVYMWHKQGSIHGGYNTIQYWDSIKKEPVEFMTLPSELQSKVFANLKYSLWTSYYDLDYSMQVTPRYFNSDSLTIKSLESTKGKINYMGNYDTLITPLDKYYIVSKDINEKISKALGFVARDPVRIKYKSSSHAVFSVHNDKGTVVDILPTYSYNDDWDILRSYGLPDTTPIKFPWYGTDFYNDSISINQGRFLETEFPPYPYLYLAELSREIPYNILYGGTEHNSLETINWIPISEIKPLEYDVTTTEGDTYFQRWDCLKTYPYTKEDINQVIDVTSFMVETHINLESRYDTNRGYDNLVNLDPNVNFNKLNPVYSQTNNLFSYNILDEKYNTDTYGNQLVYSLPKSPKSDVDVWTNITANSALNLNGANGSITKLINIYDQIVAFQPKAVSVVAFNNKNALTTENGEPIEIVNSGKVQGYQELSTTIGCLNKDSICVSNGGVYFIDDYNRALFRYNKEGLSNVSSKGMMVWFNNNITSKERVFYDTSTNDVYVTNKNYCIAYNESLDTFTSFYDYYDIPLIFNIKNKPFLLQEDTDINIYRLYDGEYNTTIDGRENKGYYTIYNVNPAPQSDKIFSNIEYIADCTNTEGNLTQNIPYTELEVWNEYQRGITDLTSKKYTYPNSEKKFRIWRLDVPRNTGTIDRIRNPWIKVKLSKNNPQDNDLTEIHNFIIKYFS